MKTITATELQNILASHKLWIETNGNQGQRADLFRANLTGANLYCANLSLANLTDANLTGANITGADLHGANLTNAILPDISWIIPGCLVQLNQINYGFYLKKENKLVNFVQDSFGFFIQNNV